MSERTNQHDTRARDLEQLGMQTIDSVRVLRDTDGVRCVKFDCGHERVLSAADYSKLERSSISPMRARCVACEYEQGGGEVTRG